MAATARRRRRVSQEPHGRELDREPEPVVIATLTTSGSPTVVVEVKEPLELTLCVQRQAARELAIIDPGDRPGDDGRDVGRVREERARRRTASTRARSSAPTATATSPNAPHGPS
jgi:hypothetical protein